MIPIVAWLTPAMLAAPDRDKHIENIQRSVKAGGEADVRMSCHPKDPPVKVMRGVERLITNTDEIEKFVDAIPSPSHGFTFCQGTVTEMGEDAVEAIRCFGSRDRINHAHFLHALRHAAETTGP